MIEAEENLPKAQRGRDHPVSEFIRLIGQLFAIQSRCEGTTPTDQLLVRQLESRVIIEQIEGRLLRQLYAVLPQSAFCKALCWRPPDPDPRPILSERQHSADVTLQSVDRNLT